MDEHNADEVTVEVVAEPRRADDSGAVERPHPETEWLLVADVAFLATLAVAFLYRANGFAGPAAFLAVAPPLMLVAARRRRLFGVAGLLYGLVLLVSLKLVWCGSALQVAVGFGLVAGIAMVFSGQRPYVLRTAIFISQTIMSGYAGLYRQWEATRLSSPRVSRSAGLGVLLPAAALLVFGTLFVLANPNLIEVFGDGFVEVATRIQRWFVEQGPRPSDIVFWIAAAWIAMGTLRPLMRETLASQGLPGEERETVSALVPVRDPLFAAYRNTLVAVAILFAVYLAFEFQTLWFRDFPEGFHYSGYAHRGAFWLTVSLALATAVLSVVFRGGILDDPRLSSLKRLAWIWSFENVLLAVAVYNRLLIYVGFNGMTRMRVVGFLGISAVVAGFVLVLVKIAARHNFVWVVRRQLWALAGFVVLYATLPVDFLVTRYNVARVLAGDAAPAVQISQHPIRAEGLIELSPLLESEDETIREGIRALLAGVRDRRETLERNGPKRDWTRFQGSELLLDRQFDRLDDELHFEHEWQRIAARERFDDYVYRWW